MRQHGLIGLPAALLLLTACGALDQDPDHDRCGHEHGGEGEGEGESESEGEDERWPERARADDEWSGDEFCDPEARTAGLDGYLRCDERADACDHACCRIATCAASEFCCVGVGGGDRTFDGRAYEWCVDLCAQQPALAIVVNSQRSCDVTVRFAAGASPDGFAPVCLDQGIGEGW